MMTTPAAELRKDILAETEKVRGQLNDLRARFRGALVDPESGAARGAHPIEKLRYEERTQFESRRDRVVALGGRQVSPTRDSRREITGRAGHGLRQRPPERRPG